MVGTMVNVGLSLLEYTQAYDFFRDYPNDPLSVRLSVVALLLSNVATLVLHCISTYRVRRHPCLSPLGSERES